ncbi:hypothetical protein U0070_023694 [Myodes glareolus]|uniref:Uncharacterized protein n=1 Tax=Myodes glareolus TaxID=447135 RepID=A0AAW0HA96_MYOGA
MELLGCQAAVSRPSCERMHTLGGMLLLVGHLVEKLVSYSRRLSQAEPSGTKVGPVARDFGLHSNCGPVQD